MTDCIFSKNMCIFVCYSIGAYVLSIYRFLLRMSITVCFALYSIQIPKRMYGKCNLKIGCLNIGGNANVKCVSPDLVGISSKHDIFIVLETWLEGQDQCPKIDGFMNFRSERNKKSRAKRNAGGLIVYYKQTIGKCVHKLKSASSDIIWIKLDKSYFGVKNDVFLCAAYISPQNSTSDRDITAEEKFDQLRNELDYYSALGEIAIIGDLNSRIENAQEYHIGFDLDCNAADITRSEYVPPRNSRDNHVNSYGRQLLKLLTDYDMLIVNGRVCGDMYGSYTCCQWNGCSVIDMLIVQNNWLLQGVRFWLA